METKVDVLLEESSKGAFLRVECINGGPYDSGLMEIRVIFLRNPESPDDVKTYATEMANVYAKGKSMLILFDASNLTMIAPAHLLALHDVVQSTKDEELRFTFASAAVLPGGPLTKIIQKLFHRKAGYPLKFTTKLQEAEEFLRKHSS